MGKNARDTRPKLKPVKKIELSEKNTTLRFVLLIVLLLIAAISFTVFLFSLFSKGEGWRTVDPSADKVYYNGEITLQYDIGKGKENATAEYKRLAALYGEALTTAHKNFSAYESFAGVTNIRSINNSRNQELTVSPLLYRTLKMMVSGGNRMLYMAPVYSIYYNVFGSQNDILASESDPNTNYELYSDVKEVLSFINDPTHVNLAFVDDDACRIRLNVSTEYEEYLNTWEYDTIITLGVFELAFVVDYVSDTLQSNGHARGIVTSFDGYTRNLGMDGKIVSSNIHDISAKREVMQVAKMNYTGALSSVNFRNYPVIDIDLERFYVYENGRVVSNFIDPTTGKNAGTLPTMTFYSRQKSCAEIALMAYGFFVSDVLDGEGINNLCYLDVYTVYALDKTVFFNEEALKTEESLEMVLQGYNKSYLFE